jgi:hypothetical protein
LHRLEEKAEAMNSTGFMDAPIFEGQTVTPHDFNTLRRIRDEDGSVIEEQEQFTELASNEAMLQLLRSLMEAHGRRILEELPDGIHSGLAWPGQRGLFFYFAAPAARGEGRRHYWRYYDFVSDRIVDNRFVIANLIACAPDTPRVVDSLDVFAIQEKVINHIVRAAQEQRAVEAAPKIVDPIQQTASTPLRSYLNSPQLQRKEVKAAIQILAAPLPRVHAKALRQAYEGFSKDKHVTKLVETVLRLKEVVEETEPSIPAAASTIKREDLHLICFDCICS